MRLSIQQQFAHIGMSTRNAKQDIVSPRGELTINQSAAAMDFQSEPGELSVDSSDALAAVGVGGHLRNRNFIYSQCEGIALQAIAKIVREGNRMADATNPANAFAEIAKQEMARAPSMKYVENASFLNVEVQYTQGTVQTPIRAVPNELHYTSHKPKVDYTLGQVDINLRNKQSIDIQVSPYSWDA